MIISLSKYILVVFAATRCSCHRILDEGISIGLDNSTKKHHNNLRRGLSTNIDEEITYEDIPDMSDEEIKGVMDWIAAEVGMVKNPFCWKDSYGRGVGTLPGRVSDCPSGYTNHGLTCARGTDDILAPSRVADCPQGYTNMGYTCFRGVHSIHTPSRVADCPHGYTNMGLTCHRWWPPHTLSGGPSRFTCPSGYFKSSITARCHKNCPSGYKSDGEFCTRHAHSLGMSSMTCPEGYFQSKATARCHKNCPSDYTNMGETCHRPLSVKGLESMSCKPDERPYLGGARCFPQIGECFDNGEKDAGLCYPRCRDSFDGVGPVCWGFCDDSMVNCGMACAKTSAECALAVADQAIATLVLAANVATLGLATPATAGATATIQVGGKTVAGTSKVGKALVLAVSKLQTINPGGLEKGASVVRRIFHARTGNPLRRVTTFTKIDKATYKAMKQYRELFAEDFAEQTSPDIERELDSHFLPATAKFLKGLWGERMINDLAKENAWQIASTALVAASVVDITGVTGVVSAYAKPVCDAIVHFPCTSADLKCNDGPTPTSPTPTQPTTPTDGSEFLADYIFHPFMDSHGHDIRNQSGGLEVVARACSSYPLCKGFNSNGWMKHTVIDKSRWSKWTDDSSKGFYVKISAPTPTPPTSTAPTPATGGGTDCQDNQKIIGALNCMQDFVDNGECNWDHWTEMYIKCELSEAGIDDFVLTLVKDSQVCKKDTFTDKIRMVVYDMYNVCERPIQFRGMNSSDGMITQETYIQVSGGGWNKVHCASTSRILRGGDSFTIRGNKLQVGVGICVESEELQEKCGIRFNHNCVGFYGDNRNLMFATDEAGNEYTIDADNNISINQGFIYDKEKNCVEHVNSRSKKCIPLPEHFKNKPLRATGQVWNSARAQIV